ncbi:MAG: hypothetical protein ABJB47_11580 [Actinomycetota bacterium]
MSQQALAGLSGDHPIGYPEDEEMANVSETPGHDAELLEVPADIPDGRPAAIARLEVLVGQWEVTATFEAGFFGPGSAEVQDSSGRTTFEWLDGEFFLIQRFRTGNPAAPDGLAVIGTADGPGTLRQHYYDSRGVERVYEMSLTDGVWKVWRDEPGFCQLFSGAISSDGKTIEGAWEKSADGSQWKHDFTLTYRKLS